MTPSRPLLPLLYHPLFLLRRLLFSLSLLIPWGAVQIHFHLVLSLLSLSYQLTCKPFCLTGLNLQDMFNEILIIAEGYLSLCILNSPGDYKLGWSVVGIIGCSVVINVIVVAAEVIRGVKKGLRWITHKINP